jgi:hypothetical protein
LHVAVVIMAVPAAQRIFVSGRALLAGRVGWGAGVSLAFMSNQQASGGTGGMFEGTLAGV